MILYYCVLLCFVIWQIRNTFFWIKLWQENHYSLIRLLYYLVMTYEGRSTFLSLLSVMKIALLIITLWVLIYSNAIPFALYIVILFLYIYQVSIVVSEVIERKNIIQRFTVRDMYIYSLTIFFSLTLLAFPLLNKTFWIIMLDILTPLWIAFAAITTYLPWEFYKEIVTAKAEKKMKLKKNSIKIAIIGTYGQEAIAEYSSYLLSTQFHIARLDGKKNIADFASQISNFIYKDTHVILATIDSISQEELIEKYYLFKPSIIIISGIGHENESFYKNRVAMIDSYRALLKVISKDTYVICNGNDEDIKKLYTQVKRPKTITYVNYLNTDFPEKTGVEAFSIKEHTQYCSFLLKESNVLLSHKRIHADVVGQYELEYLLSSLVLCNKIGLPYRFLLKQLSGISNISNNVQIGRLSNGAQIIDGTFDNSLNTLFHIVDYSTHYKNKKILVLDPPLLIGKDKNIYKSIGQKVGGVFDEIVTLNTKYLQELTSGIEKEDKKKITYLTTTKVVKYIKEVKTPLLIAFAGKNSKIVLSQLSYERV